MELLLSSAAFVLHCRQCLPDDGSQKRDVLFVLLEIDVISGRTGNISHNEIRRSIGKFCGERVRDARKPGLGAMFDQDHDANRVDADGGFAVSARRQ